MTEFERSETGREITAAIRKYHRDFTEGKYEDAVAAMAPGMTVYSPFGVLQEVPKSREDHLQLYKQLHEQGFRQHTVPRYIDGTVHGDVVVTTFLEQGLIVPPGSRQPQEVVRRATQVWTQVENRWLISHMHVSNLEAADPSRFAA